MPKSLLSLVLILCLWAGDAVAGGVTAYSIVKNAIGKTAGELIAEQGLPSIQYDFPPWLRFEYDDVTIDSRKYLLSYVIMGHKVMGGDYFETDTRPALQTGPDFDRNWLGDFIGLNADGVMGILGPPNQQIMVAPFFPETLNYTYGDPAEAERTDNFTFELANGRVVMAHYSRMGPVDVTEAKALVLGLDARLLTELHDPVWLL